MFRFHVLGLLRNRASFHGYALMKEYNRRTGREYGAGYFYRQLGDLTSAGYVRPAQKKLGVDPRRAPYEITDAGIEAFDEWFEEVPREPLESDVVRIARAMFFADVDPDRAARVLATWQRDLMDQARNLERDLEYARKKRKDPVDVRPMLIERDLSRVAGDLGFLESVGAAITERAAATLSDASPPELHANPPEPTPR